MNKLPVSVGHLPLLRPIPVAIRRRYIKRIFAFLFLGLSLFPQDSVAAHPIEPVPVQEMIDHATFPGGFAEPVRLGSDVFFAADDGIHGKELWRTDGSVEGTRMVRNLNPHEGSSPRDLAVINGILLFAADDGLHGGRLWKSDGTADGTALLQASGLPMGPHVRIMDPVVVQDVLFFAAGDHSNGYELWKTNGTEEGTSLVKKINLNGSSNPQNLTSVNNEVFFSADDGIHGRELWKSDGTSEGTRMVRDLRAGEDGSDLYNLVDANGILFFAVGAEIWKSDGTEEGTMLIVRSGFTGEMVVVDGKGFFILYTGDGPELWSTDGTPEGTSLVQKSRGLSPESLVGMNGAVYFTADDGVTGRELWRSDGSEEGTVIVSDLHPALGSDPAYLTTIDGSLYFEARFLDEDEGQTRVGTWKTDGTEGGTVLLQEGHGRNFIGLGDFVLFHFRQIWRTDGTEAGTGMVTSVRNTSFHPFLSVGENLFFFTPNDRTGGHDLWKNDGTVDGSRVLWNFWELPVSPWSLPHSPSAVSIEDRLFFGARSEDEGLELWVSGGIDGTSRLLSQEEVADSGFKFRQLTSVGTQLFFSADFSARDPGLWKSDGTAAGTVSVQSFISEPKHLTNVAGTLYFTAPPVPFAHPFVLWKSDGTTAGTQMVNKDVPGSAGMDPSGLTDVNGILFYGATDSLKGIELWKSDGTPEGSRLVRDIRPGGDSHPRHLINVNGALFFSADDGIHGRELFRSDGTEEGTILVRDIHPTGGSEPQNLVEVEGTLYFTAYDGIHGRQLWKSDGTEQGTVHVKTIPNDTGAIPAELIEVNGRLFFTADDGIHGRELWTSDGTESGTVMVSNLSESSHGSIPANLTEANGALFFTATGPGIGRELYFLTTPPTVAVPAETRYASFGEAVELTVDAKGHGLVYQWYHEGWLIEAATSASLVIDSAQATDSGSYRVVISNGSGSTEAIVQLTVRQAPVIRDLNFQEEGLTLFISAEKTDESLQLQASDDLMNWFTLTVIEPETNVSGEFQFLDTDANGLERRFYRVISLP